MMKKILLPVIGLLSVVAFAADPGHILEIKPWYWDGGYDKGYVTNYSYSAENPAKGGEKLWFVIRLLNNGWSTNDNPATAWEFPRSTTGLGNESAKWAASPAQIGIVVSGRTVGATIYTIERDDYINEKLGVNSAHITDIVCYYTVQPGDFAQPIRLAADAKGTPVDRTDSIELIKPYIIRSNQWKWYARNGIDEVVWEWPGLTSPQTYDWGDVPEGGRRTYDPDFSQGNLYVRTVDFTNRGNETGEPTWYTAGTVWRGVREGSDEVEPSSATLTLTGISTEKTTLYVWSEDDGVIKMGSGDDVTMKTRDGLGTTNSIVYTVEFAAGEPTKTLPLVAVGVEGRSTSLILSEFKGFRTLDDGTRDEDYCSIPVAVIERPQPTVKVVAAASKEFTVEAKPDAWEDHVGEVYLVISGGYQEKADTLKVTLTPSISGVDNWSDYVHIARSSENCENADPLVFTYTLDNEDFAAGREITEKVYIFGLGADWRTSVGGVKLTPELGEGTVAYFQDPPTALTVKLVPEEPSVSVDKVESTGNFKRRFDIKVTDNHKNTIDGSGYTVSYSFTNTVTGRVVQDLELDGKWMLDGNHTLVSVDDQSKRPEINFSVGRYDVVFTVTTPAGDKYGTSGIAKVNVNEPETASAEIVLEDGTTSATGTYNESDETTISVQVKLSKSYPNGQAWAFLAPVAGSGTAERSGGQIVTNAVTTIGMKIGQDEEVSEVGGLLVIDGKGGTGSVLSYDVVLCTTEQFDPDNIIQSYQSKTLKLTAKNVAPSIGEVSINGIKTAKLANHHVSSPIPSGRANTIKPYVSDVMTDLAGDMVIELSATSEYGDMLTPMVVTNKTTTMTAEFNNVVFSRDGKWTVTVTATDKDGAVSNDYEFSFNVKKPNITIGTGSGNFTNYLETATNAQLPLSLSFFDTSTNLIVVKVTVKAPSATDDYSDTGRFVLSSAYKDNVFQIGNSNVVYPELAYNEYYVPFYSASTEMMEIVDLDGTYLSGEIGYKVEAEVVTEGLTAPYSKVSKTVYVENVAPKFSDAVVALQNNETNFFNVGREISWSIKRGEVAADLTNSWEAAGISGEKFMTNGVRVAISGCANEGVFFVRGSGTYKFKPAFDNGSVGLQTVTMSIEDKDEGVGDSLIFYYKVPLSKTLVTAANGPSGGTANIALSTLYAAQKGIGEGHVFVSGMDWEKVENFAIKWYCDPGESTVKAYAFGYINNAVDNGLLDYDTQEGKARDVAINTSGNRAQDSDVPANPYKYTDQLGKDSFPYGWIQSTEPGGNEYAMNLGIGFDPSKPSDTWINLPTEANKDGAGYVQAYAEAVFSKEYSPYDNMGDINQDGVPDFMALKRYTLAKVDNEGGDLLDVGRLSDGDYLPDATNLGKLRVLPGTWVTNSQPFTAKQEIRGFGDGLNYGMFKFDDAESTAGWISDLQLTDNEKMSLLAHAIRRRDEIFANWIAGKRDDYAGFDGTDNYKGDFEAITNLLGTTISIYTSYFGDNNKTVPAYFAYECPTNDILAVGTNVTLTITNEVIMVDGTTNKVERINDCWLYTFTDSNWNVLTVTNLVEAITNITKRGTSATTNVYWKSASDKITVNNINVTDWLNNGTPDAYRKAMAAAKKYIDRTWVRYQDELRKNGESSNWGWTCENRTDPTVVDTDGDGMNDGYEYFFWYASAVGVYSATGNSRLTGSAFDRTNITSYDKTISPEEIAKIYNPNIARVWTAQDTDGDGIYDLEEFALGTSPVHWDTDRDGISDFFELTYETKTLSDDSGMNNDGDFMAYASSTNSLSALSGYKYIYTATNGTLWALNVNCKREMKEAVDLANAYGYETNVFEVADAKGFQVARYCGEYIPVTLDTANFENSSNITNGMFDTGKFFVVPGKGLLTDPDSVSVALFHKQVLNYFGFDPRTAWSCDDDGNLAVTQRRKTAAVNTRPYTAKYEYTLHDFLNAVGITVPSGFDAPIDLVRSRMTNPSKAVVSATVETPTTTTDEETGETTTTVTTETIWEYGADTDGDGVPDGWELYIGVNPCIRYGAKDESELSYQAYLKGIDDADKMGLAQEFAGTDSCAVYSDCPTIYKSHPSQGDAKSNANFRWYNKFWPTDPRSSDTDGDTIPDNMEHDAWAETFTFNRFGDMWGDTVWHYSIYGEPYDYGDPCIAGGGFNPCTIDTDLDGLPDPWEYQYAGVIFYEGEVARNQDEKDLPTSFHGPVPDDTYGHDDFDAELSMGSWYWRLPRNMDGAIVSRYYIMMGQDGTVPDATTYSYLLANNDWDGDGLENWQEYMVQSLRHLRYDDDKTPLLGRDSPLVTVVNETSGRCEFTPGEWCADAVGDGTNRFLKTSFTMPFSNTQLKFIGEKLGYKNFAAWAGDPSNYAGYSDYLAALGYFSAPPRAWDPAKAYKYMLPRAKPAKYYTTSRSSSRTLVGFKFVGETETRYWDDYNPELPDDLHNKWYWEDGKLWVYVRDGADVYSMEAEPVYENVTTTYNLYEHEFSSSIANDEYFSTDPRLWDTDNDGMDDYYELFHGLNPILGNVSDVRGSYVYKSDIIARAMDGRITPWNNAWTGWNTYEAPVCDPIKAPWMMGTASADADGDGLRNNEEMILANVTDPSSTHTDPTPLWMTDSSVLVYDQGVYTEEEARDSHGYPKKVRDENGALVNVTNKVAVYEETAKYGTVRVTVPVVCGPSYTALYYSQSNVSSYNDSKDDIMYIMSSGSLMWGSRNYVYLTPFEENEGYDTDNDWRSDSVEAKNTPEPTSDPLDSSDPARRQSIWFGGPEDPGAAVTMENSMRWADNFNLYRQFTVEAWVRPENVTDPGDKVVACRACRCEGWDADNTNTVVRLNFAIGIDGEGKAFALTQNTTTNECRITDTTALADGKWTHLASTYDGSTLKLYVNGKCVSSIGTNIIPANGTDRTTQDGQSLGTIEYHSRVERSATMIGAKPKGDGAFGWGYTAEVTGWSEVAECFLKGSVDEVRFWEGARTESQIGELMYKRIDAAMAKELRDDVFSALGRGASRNNNGANKSTLPPELVQHYNFSTLAGATETNFVQQVPPGFINKVLGVVRDPNDGSSLSDMVNISWWKGVLESPVGSKVYKSEHIVPWIEDTVGHLPALCGAVEDSVYWSENYAGYTAAEKHGLDKYVFPNTMNPYTKVTYNGLYSDENYTDAMYNLEMKLRWLEKYTNTASLVRDMWGSGTLYERFRYDLEHGFVGCRDLVPVGSAYAKRLTEYWDGAGPEDAWAVTKGSADEMDGDPDDNGIPAWAGDTSAREYRIDLEDGLLPTGEYDPDYTTYSGDAEYADTNGNMIPDWWERHFGILGCEADEDLDNDGLSNYHEYLVSFGDWSIAEKAPSFRLGSREVKNIGMPFLDPTDPHSTGKAVTDYFLKPDYSVVDDARVVTNSYIGELITDHDFIEMWWENMFGSDFSNPAAYDPYLDKDGDGWDNFSEARAYAWYGSYWAKGVDRYLDDTRHFGSYPQPTIGVAITYKGVQDVTGKGLVVRTRTPNAKRVDATFDIPGADDGVVNVTKFMGGYAGKTTLRGFLHPGRINAVGTSVEFMNAPLASLGNCTWSYDWYTKQGIKRAYYYGYDLHAIYDNSGNVTSFQAEVDGQAVTISPGKGMGTYEDYVSEKAKYPYIKLDNNGIQWTSFANAVADSNGKYGEIYLSASNSTGKAVYIGTLDYATGEFDLDLEKAETLGVALDGTVFGVTYAYRIGREWPQTLWLNEPTAGRIKQGRNIVEAFIDINGNGIYDVGEPYGAVNDVDVGWHKTDKAVTIELKDESPVFMRTAVEFAKDAGENDDVPQTAKFVVRRIAINTIRERRMPLRTLSTATAVSDDRPYLTEADVVSSMRPDLDWMWLAKDAAAIGEAIESATYEIARVDTLEDGSTTNVVIGTYTRTFSMKRTAPTALAPVDNAIVYSACPTFVFSCEDDTMTAYRIQVSTNATVAGVVWDSGVAMLPGRAPYTTDVASAYSVTPSFYVDTFATTNGSAVLKDGENYFWRVTLLNSKFNTSDDSAAWSGWAGFKMDVGNNDRNPDTQTGYGTAAAAVRYYGVGDVTGLSGMTNIVVEAYATADFTGLPLARTRVADLALLDSDEDVTTTNAVLRGVLPGQVYLMAYIDANNNCKRDSFESWGYANKVGYDSRFIYSPEPVEVNGSKLACPSSAIFIEDCDINQNEIVDALELGDLSSSTSGSGGDSDGDGLADDEELDYGCDPFDKDSDGDGMPDGWEAKFANLDPMMKDADETADGDVMAYCKIDGVLVSVWDGSDLATRADYLLSPDAKSAPIVGASVDGLALCSAWECGSVYGYGTNVTLTAGKVYEVADVTSALIHAQVYDAYGFDRNTANGSVPEAKQVRTKPFTALDKYLVVRYLEALGLANEDNVNRNRVWSRYTLKPGDTDYDRDGISDGWELYVMSGPAGAGSSLTVSPWNFDDRAGDPDGDGLENVYEFSRGDMPTDPWNDDTDKDGINDRASYEYMFKYGGNGDGRTGYRGDADNDQLSNFVEYMISGLDGFPEVDPTADLDPSEMSTFAGANGQLVPDYFLPQGRLYLGEIFADHDMIEDWWEDEQPADVAVGGVRTANYSRYSYDSSRDTDGDGWSNWAEARAEIMGGKVAETTVVTNIVDGVEVLVTNVTENSVYSLSGGRPAPTVKAAFSYRGENLSSDDTLVVKAWCATSSTRGEHDAMWTMEAGDLKAGLLQVELGTPDEGELREGENTFVAYVTDGSSTDYAVGMPYGSTKGVRISYLKGAPFSLELTDVNPTAMRVNLSDAITIQRKLAAQLDAKDDEFWSSLNPSGGSFSQDNWDAYYAMLSSNYEEVVKTSIDRRVADKYPWAALAMSRDYVGTNLDFSATGPVQLWITQALINETRGGNGEYYRLLGSIGVFDLGSHPVLTEVDMVPGRWFDIGGYVDANGVARSTIDESYMTWNNGYSIDTLESATFAITLQYAPSASYSAENNILIAQMVNHYDVGEEQPATTEKTFTANGSQPTFRWKHTSAIGKPYPAFQLKIWDSDGKLVFDSGVQRSPVRGADGCYSWTAPIWAGSLTPQGEVFEADREYRWDVSMLDAKFVDFNGSFEAGAKLRISNVADLSDYGQIAVGVKYMGPGTVKVAGAKGIIRVEAYATPDFSGSPVGAGYVKNKGTIGAIDRIAMNALVTGLPKGSEYYVLAYLDSNGDGVRQSWESWGYGCYVGDPDRRDVYTPRAYGVSTTEADDLKTTTCVIYIEDCDTNGNKLPDTLELDSNGEFAPTDVETALSPYIVTVDGDGTIKAENIYKSIEKDVIDLPYYSMLMQFENDGRLATPSLALAMAGLSAEQLAALNPEPKVVITAFSRDEGIAIEVDPTATVDGKTLEAKSYNISVRLKFTFEWTPNLASEWRELSVSTTATLDIREKRTFAQDDAALKDTVNKEIAVIAAENPTAFFRLKSVDVVED